MKLRIETIGTGKPLVLLHAFPLNQSMFSKVQIPGYKMILPNFPGFGSQENLEIYSFEKASDDLFETLNEFYIPSERMALGGISMGGYWAFEFLRKYPEKVSKLILISTRAGIDSPEGKMNRFDMIRKVEKEGIRYLPESLIPGLLGPPTIKFKPQIVGSVRKLIMMASSQGIVTAQKCMAERRDQSGFLSQIQVPALVIAGQEDPLIPISESKNMARCIPRSVLKTVEGVGHLIPMEDPDAFSKILSKFLS